MPDDKQSQPSETKPSPAKPSAKKGKKKSARSPIMPIFAVLLLAGGLGAYLYTQNRTAPVEAPEPEPEPVIVEVAPEPEPVIVEVAPEPVIPDPVEIEFSELAKQRALWPQSLTLTQTMQLDIIYNGETFGQMTFTAGQEIKVSSLEAPANILGKVGGQFLSIPASSTDLAQWFEQAHAATHILKEIQSHSDNMTATTPSSDEELYDELERWCLVNFGDCTLEIGPDKLTLNWKKQAGLISYPEEATFLAHHYLKLQAARGQGDNYAQCEIIDSRTGKTLGLGVAFMPAGLDIH